MRDTLPRPPDHSCLFDHAAGQHGFFTSAQARECGFNWDMLTYHARTGRFKRVRRGLYRLRDYPSSPREEVMVAWLAAGKDAAVVSHESALDLLELSDVIPNQIHLTVPRSRRHHPDLPGVVFHTTSRPYRPADVIDYDGMRVTAANRTIVDAAEAGTAPEQIEKAVHEAIERGIVSPAGLERDASLRNRRVRRLIHGALAQIQ